MEITLPVVRHIASGEGWRVRDIVCNAKVGEPAFEEAHERHVMAVVKRGVFGYHGHNGRELLHGGSLLVGNSGNCYACKHDHSDGDHCLALQLDEDLYAEIAATHAGHMNFQFSSAQLPQSPKVFSAAVNLEMALHQDDSLRHHEAVFQFAETVLSAASQVQVCLAPSPDMRRIGEVVNFIEDNLAEVLTLQKLADLAGLSRYHFLRVFKLSVGMTPHQFILRTRLKRAVDLLLTTRLPVIDVGLSSGFGDLSTFNRTFKAQTGMTPRMMRH